MSLELKGINVTYPGMAKPVLSGFNLSVPAGSSTALMGPSGSGKSTVLAVAGLLLRPDQGEIWINQRRRTIHDGPALLGSEISWILQTVSLLPRRSALDNVLLPVLARGARRDSSHADAVEWLARVGVRAPDQSARTLSGGQAQRVGIARALISRPSVLIADEPTANLDVATARDVARTLLQAAEGTTVLIATHDPQVAKLADRVVLLELETTAHVAF